MSYADFSLTQVKREFALSEKLVSMFEHVSPCKASSWLTEALDIGMELALSTSSEKARSEFIVVPILFEIEKRNRKKFSIYSGEKLDVDQDKGLVGECDFLLSKGPVAHTIQIPIFALVEAKKNDISSGLGQCTAQMLGAKIYNEMEGNDVSHIYGCVTTGEDWQFLKLIENTLCIERKRYYIDHLEMILGIFQSIVDEY
jgi:hypothetical protein